MAYVPPHKRHSNDADKMLVPDSMASRFEEKLNLGSRFMPHGRKNKKLLQGPQIIYAKHAISKWWPFGSTAKDPIPESAHLEPFPPRHVDRVTGEIPLVLVGGHVPAVCLVGGTEGVQNEPWVSITDKILPDLVSTLENLSNELQHDTAASFKPSLVARFGKILFHGGSSLSIDAIRQAALSQADSRKRVHKSFHTNVPKEFVQYVENVIPDIGMAFVSNREHYHVKISDRTQPDSIISCKCIVLDCGKELEVYKVELNQVRHLVVDISCIYKDLDLRVLLYNKRILVELDDEEKDCINKLVKAAIIDPDVKGGLRWPVGKESVGDRFTIVGIWHTNYKTFRGPTLKLKLRNADRFDFKTSSGEATTEVSLKMTELSKFLEKGVMEADPIKQMLEENIQQIIWNHFMSCKATWV